MDWALIAAFLTPLVFAFANVYDKYVVSKKVKDPFSYAAVQGIVVLIFGLIIAVFVSWKDLTFYDVLFPVLAGILYGSIYYIYFFVMKNSDASYVSSFLFLFPIVVAVLSFVFLGERLSLVSYAAIAIILLGVVLFSARVGKIKLKNILVPLIIYVFFIGGYEFFAKVTTNNITFMQGLDITTLAIGVTVLSGLFTKKVRGSFTKEFPNIKWASVSEAINLLGILTIYFAVSRLSVTFVSAVGAVQPLIVLGLEKAAHSAFGNMIEDVKILPKLGAIILIVLGVVLLTVFGS